MLATSVPRSFLALLDVTVLLGPYHVLFADGRVRPDRPPTRLNASVLCIYRGSASSDLDLSSLHTLRVVCGPLRPLRALRRILRPLSALRRPRVLLRLLCVLSVLIAWVRLVHVAVYDVITNVTSGPFSGSDGRRPPSTYKPRKDGGIYGRLGRNLLSGT